MSREIDEGRRILNELSKLIDIERKSKWFGRWAIRNAIIAKLKYRIHDLYRAVEARS